MHLLEEETQRVLLASVDTGEYDVEESMEELAELVRSAGGEVKAQVIQPLPSIRQATYLGIGKLKEVKEAAERLDVNLLIFDTELTGAQMRNIEAETGIPVIDRTMLILDIFASRARSSEGKLQVELAQLKYMLPRLGGKGTSLSRLGGGIGTRGPGETKLETDRRHIRRRISKLKEQLEEVEKRRGQIQRRRQKNGVITVALVGYTNAGKSTLMNALTQAGVLAKDMLFATLDPTARALKLPCGKTVMLIDTVGLVRRLPHHLVEAFHSTLEQAATADIILNVCDASSSEAQVHLDVTRTLLAELGCGGRPIIPVLNKCDLVPSLHDLPMIGNAVRISAKTGRGLDALLESIEENLPVKTTRVELLLPFAQGGLAAKLRKDGTILQEEYTADGLKLTAQVDPVLLHLVQDYVIFPHE